MDLSIIIPSFNTKSLLDRCLRSIFSSLSKSKLKSEVIVVDNGSTDGSLGVAKEFGATLIQNKENVGYGKANNQGIKLAKGEIILLLNSDIKVIDDGIQKLHAFARAHPKSFSGGKLLNEDGSDQSSCGPAFTLGNIFLMLFVKGDALGLTRWSPQEEKNVAWVSGACLLGSKKAFQDVGLFDEAIFMYMDEVEFLQRAREKGYWVIFYPDARFIHSGAASSGSRRKPVLNIYRGLIYFFQKHRGPLALAGMRFMLRTKALAGIVLGRMIGKRDLTITYEEAIGVV